jgi:hypothetical protein
MIKRLNQLRRQYHKLTLFERIRLFLAAYERGDLPEIYALDDSCPSADAEAYMGRILALERTACLLATQMLALDILVIQRFTSLAGEHSTPPNSDPALVSLLKRQAALWRGFVAFCQLLEHDPRQVLRLAPIGLDKSHPAFFILHELIALLDRWAEDPDPDQVAQWQWLFAQLRLF